MANYQVINVEGIGPQMAVKLNEAGIMNTDQLLTACKTPAMRADLASKTGISDKLILRFANMVDLFRITGVGAQYAELLEASGVDTVVELSNRNPENLVAKMEEVNAEKRLVRRTPPATSVKKWVLEAKTLPRVLEY